MWKKLAVMILPQHATASDSLDKGPQLKHRYKAVRDLIATGSNCALKTTDFLTVYWSALAVPDYVHYQLPVLDQEHKRLLEHTSQVPPDTLPAINSAFEQIIPRDNAWRPWNMLTKWELAQYHPVLLAIMQGQLRLFEQVWNKVKSERFSLDEYEQPRPTHNAPFVYLYLLLMQVAVIYDRREIMEMLLQPVVLFDAAKKHFIDLYVVGLAVKYNALTIQGYFERGHDDLWSEYLKLTAKREGAEVIGQDVDFMMADLEKHILQYGLTLSLTHPLMVHIPEPSASAQ
ncbi:hypothetical protein H4R35_000037 [Dimargaris xerosporica]|nr:hypothetical protein H4R35_000037 [Dimargaris xerosporica]